MKSEKLYLKWLSNQAKQKQVHNGTIATKVPENNPTQSVYNSNKSQTDNGQQLTVHNQTTIKQSNAQRCKPQGLSTSLKAYKTNSRLVINKQ